MKIQRNPKFRLRLLYFYVDTGIRNAGFYWTELICFIHKYCELRKTCPVLDSIHIGGELPMRRSFSLSRYERMFSLIIRMITDICLRNHVLVPRIFTDFGTYALRGSGATMYKIVGQSAQDNAEMRYMVNGPLPQLSNATGPKERFMALPLNNNDHPHCSASLRGPIYSSADCVSMDPQFTCLHLPQFDQEKEEQYVGIFHAGAYAKPPSTSLSNRLPAAEHVILRKEANSLLASSHFTPRQGNKDTMQHKTYVKCNVPLRSGYY
jgi:arginine decarboxylase